MWNVLVLASNAMPQQAGSTCSAEYLLLHALRETNLGSWPFTLLGELCSVLFQGLQSSCGSPLGWLL